MGVLMCHFSLFFYCLLTFFPGSFLWASVWWRHHYWEAAAKFGAGYLYQCQQSCQVPADTLPEFVSFLTMYSTWFCGFYHDWLLNKTSLFQESTIDNTSCCDRWDVGICAALFLAWCHLTLNISDLELSTPPVAQWGKFIETCGVVVTSANVHSWVLTLIFMGLLIYIQLLGLGCSTAWSMMGGYVRLFEQEHW